MSSASKSSFSRVRTPMAFRASCSSGTCPLNSGGVSPRLPLYSAYSRVRNDCREMSNATARCVGFSFWSRSSSIDRNPWMAFVCCPSRVEKLSTGRA